MLRRFLIAASALLAWGELVHWRASRKCLGRGDAAKGQAFRQARRRSRAEVLGRAPEARQRDVGEADGKREAGVGEEDAVGAGVGKAVVVLGFANRGARANFVNRYRVRAGLRSLGSEGRRGAKLRSLKSDGLRAAASLRASAVRRESTIRQSPGDVSVSESRAAFADASVAGSAPLSAVSCIAHASAAAEVLVLCGGAVSGPVPEAEVMESYARARGYEGPIRLDRESRSTLQNIENAIPLIEDAASVAIVANSVHALKGRILLRRLRPDLADRLVRGADYRFGEQILVKPIAAVVGLADLRALRRRLPKPNSAILPNSGDPSGPRRSFRTPATPPKLGELARVDRALRTP